jgi:hypothetical protein
MVEAPATTLALALVFRSIALEIACQSKALRGRRNLASSEGDHRALELREMRS